MRTGILLLMLSALKGQDYIKRFLKTHCQTVMVQLRFGNYCLFLISVPISVDQRYMDQFTSIY